MRTVLVTVARFTTADRGLWLSAAMSLLDAGERGHLPAIIDPDARAGHAIGRALVRLLAAEASGLDPGRLTVAHGGDGKPRLQELPGLAFSVSHTGRLVAVGTSEVAAVGIDAEQARATVPNPRRLAQRTFAESEVAALGRLPDPLLDDWFSSAWTVQEAVGKALGIGIVPALAGVVVDGAPEPPRLVAVDPGPPADSWTLHQLTAPGGSEKLAVALPARGVSLGPVRCVSLADFVRRIAAQGATDRRWERSARRRAAR
jgi:phosphopantetheinyl transferase